MRSIKIEILKNELNNINQLILRREKYSSKKSEKWKSSEEGFNFDIETQELESIAEDFKNVIFDFENWKIENRK